MDPARVLRVSLPSSSPLVSKRFRPARPILCYVTDRRTLRESSSGDWLEPLVARIAAVAAAGVDWIQIREKDLCGKASGALVREAKRRISPQASSRLIVNDRLDIAFAERAGGVHLGENSLPVAEAKRFVHAEQAAQRLASGFLVGSSCHSLDAAKCAAAAGADYIFFGPVFATPSKISYGAPQGLDRLADVCASVHIPVLAIGGVVLDNVASCFASGAAGIAAIRLFQDSPDPSAVVPTILRETI